MYYNTTNLTQPELGLAHRMSETQEQKIYELMKSGGEWNCWTIKDVLEMEITSIRRALNTLEKENKIVQSGFKMERKGKPVGIYKVKIELKMF